MGFEVKYSSCAKKVDGPGYDLENIQFFTRKVGKADEDTSLEELAQAILKQLARRDQLVNVEEIYEFTKKKISFSESDGGVLIKNRKFNLDNGTFISLTEEVVPEVPSAPPAPLQQYAPLVPQAAQTPVTLLPQPISNPNVNPVVKQEVLGVAIRTEVFDPQYPGMLKEAKRRGYKFTHKKEYPVYEEKAAPGGLYAGMNYKTVDDEGMVQVINSLHFRPKVSLINFTEEESLAGDYTSSLEKNDRTDIRAMARSRGVR